MPQEDVRVLLQAIARLLDALEGASHADLAGKAAGPPILDDMHDPRRIKPALKRIRKLFQDPTPAFYSVKTEESALVSIVKDMIEDCKRMLPVLEGLADDDAGTRAARAGLVTSLCMVATANAEHRLWQRTATHVAPHLPTQMVEQELLNFWPDRNLVGFTARLQKLELAQAHSATMRRLADFSATKAASSSSAPSQTTRFKKASQNKGGAGKE